MVIAPPVPEAFEWAQANQAYWWSGDEVVSRPVARLLAAWERVSAHAHQLDESLRTAATALAVERVARAHQQRELFP